MDVWLQYAVLCGCVYSPLPLSQCMFSPFLLKAPVVFISYVIGISPLIIVKHRPINYQQIQPWERGRFPKHDDVIEWKQVNSPHKSRVTRSIDVFSDLRLNKRLNKQWWGWWFETPSRLFWCHVKRIILFSRQTLLSFALLLTYKCDDISSSRCICQHIWLIHIVIIIRQSVDVSQYGTAATNAYIRRKWKYWNR